MIQLKELNPRNFPTTPEIDANLQILLEKMNKVRVAYAQPMIVTSGLRSEKLQEALIIAGKSNAPKSHHLTGEAVDIQDKDGKLAEWVKANISLMEQIGLWFEDPASTVGWLHCQIVPPKSGKRFFIP